MKKKVSVVVPVYNGEKNIKRCLTSLIEQDYDNLEIIVVNDGSQDRTQKLCEELCGDSDTVQLITIDNSGVSVARNVGIQASTGEYISFVDSDDYVDRNYISTLVNNLEKNGVDVSVCNYYYVVDNVSHTIKIPQKYRGLIDRERFFEGLINNCYRGFLWNKMFRRELLFIQGEILKLKPDIAICEDLLFVVTIASRCTRFYIDDTSLYHYVQVKSSAYNASFKISRITEIKAYDEIMAIIQNEVPQLMPEYQESYLKMALKIAESYAVATQHDENISRIIKDTVDRYFEHVLQMDSVSLGKKLYYVIYKKYPKILHLAKKIYHIIRY